MWVKANSSYASRIQSIPTWRWSDEGVVTENNSSQSSIAHRSSWTGCVRQDLTDSNRSGYIQFGDGYHSMNMGRPDSQHQATPPLRSTASKPNNQWNTGRRETPRVAHNITTVLYTFLPPFYDSERPPIQALASIIEARPVITKVIRKLK